MNNKRKYKTLVSVVVPVYNKEQYIERCLNSIEKQTYRNIEIIVVNDGSIDKSQDIIDKHKSKDKRIASITKENGGLASARNAAIDIAKGDYCCFVDADDFVVKEFVEVLLNNIINYDAELAMCTFADTIEENIQKNYIVKEFNNKELMEALFKDEEVTSHACRKMYPKKVFKTNRFPEDMKVVEDMSIDHWLLKEIDKALLVDLPLYVYCMHNSDSISNTTKKLLSSSLYRAKANLQRLDFSDKFYQDISYILIPKITMFLMSSYAKLRVLYKDNKQDMDYVISNIKQYKNRILSSKEVPFLFKVVIFCIANNLRFIPYLASKYYLKTNNI